MPRTLCYCMFLWYLPKMWKEKIKMLIDMDWLWILGLIAAGGFACYWIFNFMGNE